MGRKHKITKQLLYDITHNAFCSLNMEEICDKLNFAYKLLDDTRVLKAFTKGQIEHFIAYVGDGYDFETIVKYSKTITLAQCELWSIDYNDEIVKLTEQKAVSTTKKFSNPLSNGLSNIVKQSGKSKDEVSLEVIENSVKDMVTKIQKGDTSDLINMLASSTIQLQLLNSKATINMNSKIGKTLVNLDVLSKIQLKAISEMRKNILAINEICNPKRTTFIKEANQYNRLEVNQNKIQNKNEQQTLSEFLPNNTIEDVEVIATKESVKC